jgi:hypothetical protein
MLKGIPNQLTLQLTNKLNTTQEKEIFESIEITIYSFVKGECRDNKEN